MDAKHLDKTCAQRFAKAQIIRDVNARFTPYPDVPLNTEEYNRAYPNSKDRTAGTWRMFEIDEYVIPGANDTCAPEFIERHLKQSLDGHNQINSIIRSRHYTGIGPRTIYNKLREMPNLIYENRIRPALYAAQEIDPQGRYAAEFSRLKTNYEKALDDVNRRRAARLIKPSDLIPEYERVAREHWCKIVDFINQALHYLTGSYLNSTSI